MIKAFGNMTEFSVAYHLSRELGDNIEQKFPEVPGINKGPWKFNLKSLFQSFIGIHRTVSESFKEKKHVTRLVGVTLWKSGRQLNMKCEVEIDT